MVANPNHIIEISNGIKYKHLYNTFEDVAVYEPFYNMLTQYFLTPQYMNKNIYAITTAFVKYATIYNEFEAILFPAVGLNNGYNIAFKPALIENRILIPKDFVKKQKHTKVSDNHIESESSNKIIDGKIIWNSSDWKKSKIEWQ